jgi:hypothetical protein
MATYLSDESWVRGSCEIVRKDILLECIHWVYHKVMTTVATPIDYVRKPFLVYSAVKVGNEWWHWCKYAHWWLAFNWEAWTTLPLENFRGDPEIKVTLHNLIVMVRSRIEALLVLLPNVRIKIESMFMMMLIMRCRGEMRHDQPALYLQYIAWT